MTGRHLPRVFPRNSYFRYVVGLDNGYRFRFLGSTTWDGVETAVYFLRSAFGTNNCVRKGTEAGLSRKKLSCGAGPMAVSRRTFVAQMALHCCLEFDLSGQDLYHTSVIIEHWHLGKKYLQQDAYLCRGSSWMGCQLKALDWRHSQ